MDWLICILARHLLAFQDHLMDNMEKYLLVILKCLNYLLKVKGLQCHNCFPQQTEETYGKELAAREKGYVVKIRFIALEYDQSMNDV